MLSLKDTQKELDTERLVSSKVYDEVRCSSVHDCTCSGWLVTTNNLCTTCVARVQLTNVHVSFMYIYMYMYMYIQFWNV